MTLEVPTVHEWRLLEGRRRLLSTNEVGSNQNKRSMEFPIEDKEKIRLWHSNIQVIVFQILRMDSKHIIFQFSYIQSAKIGDLSDKMHFNVRSE